MSALSATRIRAARPVASLLLAWLVGAAAAAAVVGPSSWVGRPLEEALEELLDQGLRLVYSSDLIGSEMQVLVEPTASSLHARLEQLLAPHGLTAQVGPGGHLLVVRRTRAALEVRLVAPRPDEITVGAVEVEALILGEEPVEALELYVDGALRDRLQQPPWRTTLRLEGDVSEWQIVAVARGRWGGRDRAVVRTRNVVFRDRVDVALREVYVTVTDRGGWDAELRPAHFRILDAGVEVVPTSLERTQIPLSAAVLLDTSESMQGRPLQASAAGAGVFLRQLAPVDEAMVLLFSDQLRAMSPFTRDTAQLESILEGFEAGGGTALNDHLYAALRLVDSRAGWPVVILLSDGADILSALSMAEVRWKIEASEAAIYWLRLGSASSFSLQGVSSAWRDAAGNQRELGALEDAVGASGGRVLDLADPREVAGAFDAILEELDEQYVLGYTPLVDPLSARTPSPGRRAVEVRSTLPGLRLLYSAKDFDHGAPLTP
jgi:VWFA-related protein